jgi:hypothetical protein
LQPNEFWALPSIVQELKVTAAWRLERGARRLMRWLFPQPDAGQKTAIPYGALFAENGDDGQNDDPVTNGPVMAVENSKVDPVTVVVDTAIKQCRNCGADFRPKAHNHVYCSPSCKTAYHAKKHNGRVFDAGKYRGRKPS